MNRRYLKPTNLYREAQRRLEELYLIRNKFEKQLETYPEGKIHIVKSRSRVQYYLRTDAKDKSGLYIPKKEKKKIKTFLQKKYDEATIKQINSEIKNLENLLKRVNSDIQKNYSDYPQEIKQYIDPIDVSDEDYIEEWLAIPYDRKSFSEETPMYLTDNGERVRSKSELNIANMLYKMRVPYKYECPLKLSNGKVIYPDFTVLDISKRREIYWEHRGMMDDRMYLKHAIERVKEYGKLGIFVGDNLLLTEETSTLPLGTNEIERVIKHFFK